MHKYLENPARSRRSIAKELKEPLSTVSLVLKNFLSTQTVERKPGSGRKKGFVDKIAARKIVASIRQNPGLSDSDRAIRYGTSKSTGRKMRLRAGYKSYRVIKNPNRNYKQNLVAKTRARRLYDNVLIKHGGCFIIDDETYVKCDFRQLPGRNFYASKMRGSVPDRYKHVLVDKYAKKLMIWQALCSCGKKSKCYITSGTMRTENYIEECLKKRLLPFIALHNCPVVFWPDLASCHYSKDTVKFYQDNNINFVKVDHNPPNCPQLRPIEIFWALVKRKLKKTNGAANSIKTMTHKWNKVAATFNEKFVQKLMGRITRKTREFIRS